jgi:hypothetical protein
MSWDGGEALVAIYDEGVPKTAAAFLARLPLELSVVHVAWSGDMVTGPKTSSPWMVMPWVTSANNVGLT